MSKASCTKTTSQQVDSDCFDEFEESITCWLEDSTENGEGCKFHLRRRLAVIDKCFAMKTVEEIIESLESETKNEGSKWIATVLMSLRRASPAGLKIALRTGRGANSTKEEGSRRQTPESRGLFEKGIQTYHKHIEGIRAFTIDKDNAPKWDPPTLDKVTTEKLDHVYQPFNQELELQIPDEAEECRSPYF